MSRSRKEKERLQRVRQFKAGVEPYSLEKLTAFHEAGHVVFAARHDHPVELVTIDRQKVLELTGRDCPGYTKYVEWGLRNADFVLGLTAVGLTSEAMLVSGGVINPHEEDLQLLKDMVEKMTVHGLSPESEMLRVRVQTQDFVARNSAAITAVATALMDKKTLTGDEIDQVLKSS